MRSLQLQAALTDYIEAVAGHLQAELSSGAEIPFELEQRPRRQRGSRGPALYCYAPLTDGFIAERSRDLERLPGREQAATLLSRFEGLERYLASAGVELARSTPARRAREALDALVREVFAGQSDFQLHPERLHAALGRLERSTLAAASELTLVATLHGLTITSAELPLTRGLTIAHPQALDGLPPGALAGAPEQSGGHLVVALSADDEDSQLALARGREVLQDLLRALRLFGDGRVTLGSLAWARLGGGAWSALALGTGGRPQGMLVVAAEQEDELRAFCNLVSRRAPDANELAWALRRFELGCERQAPYEGLTDHLLALRVLLEPEGPDSGLLAHRLAALCATREARGELIERTLQAIALERAVIDGTAMHHAGAATLAQEMAAHLRALLRDVLCGHLDADLIGLADELLEEPDPEPEQAPHAVPGQEPLEAASTPGRSGEEMLGDLGQSEEILDVFI